MDATPPNTADVFPGIYATKETDEGLELTIAYAMSKGITPPTDFKGEGEKTGVMKLLHKKAK